MKHLLFSIYKEIISTRVNVGTFGQCRYNRTLLYYLGNFSATSVVIAMCNPDKSQ